MALSPTNSCFSRSAVLAILVAQLGFAVFATAAETLQLPWCKPVPAAPYASRTSKVGDTVIFNWFTEAHNIYIHPNGECFDNTNRVYISESAGASYTFKPEDVGTNMTFICSVSNHCAEGQLVTFEVMDEGADVEYDLSTPCGEEGSLGMPETEPPAPATDGGESSGEMVVGWNLATTTITLLAVVGVGFFGEDLSA